MGTQIKLPTIRFAITQDNDHTRFKTIVSYSTETGFRKARDTGKIIPAKFIENFSVAVDGILCIELQLSENISRNPLFSFEFTRPVVNGQSIELNWASNKGEKHSLVTTVNFNHKGVFHYKGYDTLQT